MGLLNCWNACAKRGEAKATGQLLGPSGPEPLSGNGFTWNPESTTVDQCQLSPAYDHSQLSSHENHRQLRH